MDRLEQNEMKKLRPVKNTCYDWLMNYILEPIRENVVGFKDKIVSLFNTNRPKQTLFWRGKKLSKPKTQNKPSNIRNPYILKRKDRIIRDIWRFFQTKKERKKLEEKN